LYRALFGSGSLLIAAIVTVIGTWVLFMTVMSMLERCTGVFPLFQKPVKGRSVGLQPAVARNFEWLNRLAISIGVRPLDSFGVIDHWTNPVQEWHEPADAIITIRGLIEEVRCRPQEVDSCDQLAEELSSLLARLTEAQEQRVSFTFCLRHGSGGSAMEPMARMG
jgi:hypothetical protein